MGVCTEERPVMHWQQSARFLGPGAREKSPTPPVAHQGSTHCGSAAGVNNNQFLFRACSTCPDICEHSTKSFSAAAAAYSVAFRSYETAEQATYDESSIKYAISRTRTECSDVNDETNSGVSFKTEPYGPPSSPESANEIKPACSAEDCAGCGRLIQDRFYLSAVDKRWHVNCLQCYACRQPLDRESSCYSRDGNIYCKSDYYSFFGTRRCSRCLASIGSTELVMRARNLVFHVTCFCCVVCQTPLTKGDQYGIIDALIYCRTHYTMAREGDAASTSLGSAVVPGVGGASSYPYSSQFGSPPNDSSSPHSDPTRMVPSGIFATASHVISGLPQPPRQKGRPRKRKPKEIEALTANIGRQYLNTEYLDFGRGSHMSASSRTKRMRTSFKHHQLRTMKSYFAINHNPDAKDLKQLSQKTGLPKRVLQVWFQNARAKWRRMMMKQDGSGMLEKGDGTLDLDSISAHSPTSFMMGGGSNSPPHNLD
ncbi:protein apterous isoform X1 [Glossina fuscipes]|uniref:Protein apterous isoform X1 n=1 Tax=Glossina fuscipes TaxID=7396 RepID=A0A9C6DSV3_9MUSC|nr:protein apterous isoform X1 [Glossina fuscipes]